MKLLRVSNLLIGLSLLFAQAALAVGWITKDATIMGISSDMGVRCHFKIVEMGTNSFKITTLDQKMFGSVLQNAEFVGIYSSSLTVAGIPVTTFSGPVIQHGAVKQNTFAYTFSLDRNMAIVRIEDNATKKGCTSFK